MSHNNTTTLPKSARAIPSCPDYWATANGEIYSTKQSKVIKLTKHISKGGYWTVPIQVDRKPFTKRVARLVAEAFYGIPEGDDIVVDHIDCNRQNDKVSNLRWITKKENAWNRQAKGIFYRPQNKKNPWEAAIYASGCYHYLGSYETEAEATAAYRSAKTILHHIKEIKWN